MSSGISPNADHSLFYPLSPNLKCTKLGSLGVSPVRPASSKQWSKWRWLPQRRAQTEGLKRNNLTSEGSVGSRLSFHPLVQGLCFSTGLNISHRMTTALRTLTRPTISTASQIHRNRSRTCLPQLVLSFLLSKFLWASVTAPAKELHLWRFQRL